MDSRTAKGEILQYMLKYRGRPISTPDIMGHLQGLGHGDADECDNNCGFCDLHDHYMVWCGNDSGQAEEAGSKLRRREPYQR